MACHVVQRPREQIGLICAGKYATEDRYALPSGDGNAGTLLLVIFDEGGVHPSPWFFQPDPQKLFFVAAKAERLVRRGSREYFLVGKKPDGTSVEVRLTTGSLHMEGFF